MTIQKHVFASLFALSIGSAGFAGTLTEPEVMEVEDIPAASSAGSSGGGIILPLIALAIVAALVASDDSSAPASPGDR